MLKRSDLPGLLALLMIFVIVYSLAAMCSSHVSMNFSLTDWENAWAWLWLTFWFVVIVGVCHKNADRPQPFGRRQIIVRDDPPLSLEGVRPCVFWPDLAS